MKLMFQVELLGKFLPAIILHPMCSIVTRKQNKQTELGGQDSVRMKTTIISFLMMTYKQKPCTNSFNQCLKISLLDCCLFDRTFWVEWKQCGKTNDFFADNINYWESRIKEYFRHLPGQFGLWSTQITSPSSRLFQRLNYFRIINHKSYKEC